MGAVANLPLAVAPGMGESRASQQEGPCTHSRPAPERQLETCEAHDFMHAQWPGLPKMGLFVFLLCVVLCVCVCVQASTPTLHTLSLATSVRARWAAAASTCGGASRGCPPLQWICQSRRALHQAQASRAVFCAGAPALKQIHDMMLFWCCLDPT